MTVAPVAVDAFLAAACVPRDRSHASGSVLRAEAILAEHPEVAGANIFAAAVLGDDAAVRRFLARDPASATGAGGPHGWDPLTYLCFSNYLKLAPERSSGFVRAATALLDAGANANGGWIEPDHQPGPEWESVLYGASGVAHHPEVTRLLLERGANPNDDEAAYHTPESYDNRCLALLVATGKLTADHLAMMLIRKHDWHDLDGARYLLEHGADPNTVRRWDRTAIHHALARDNALEMFELLLDHGADPTIVSRGHTAIALAACEGRGDVLDLFARRGIPIALTGVDQLIAACARADVASVRDIGTREPRLVRELLPYGGTLLAKFAGTGNAAGVGLLLDLGVDVAAPWADGDGYFAMPAGSLAIHVAAWRGRPAVVAMLIARGSPVDMPDANGQTPLALAIRACVDSYWTERRSAGSVRALVNAGASVVGVPYPSGYHEVDALLRSHGASDRR